MTLLLDNVNYQHGLDDTGVVVLVSIEEQKIRQQQIHYLSRYLG
jgi:hypothetical protein